MASLTEGMADKVARRRGGPSGVRCGEKRTRNGGVKALPGDIDCQGATREGASPPSLLGGLPPWLGRTCHSGPCPASPRGLSILLREENAHIVKRGPKD
jgi:hypothetical protein